MSKVAAEAQKLRDGKTEFVLNIIGPFFLSPCLCSYSVVLKKTLMG
jgi:hypothetical protein